jgi:ABC-type uncharacterized transport system auxiliary subunit
MNAPKNASPSIKMPDVLLILVIAGFSAACGAARPIKYYALEVTKEPAQGTPAPLPVSIAVARVTAAHLYRDDRLVYGTNALELGTYEYERWSEPPVDMIQDSIVSSLRATKQYRSVSPVASNLQSDYVLRAHLDALDEIDKPRLAARFSLQMELYDPKAGMALWSDSYTHDEPVTGKKVIDVVEAFDRNVKAGMGQLSGSLGQYFASRRP